MLKAIHISIHQKPYFASLKISWKPEKYQVNIIFLSTFWIKKNVFPIFKKFKTISLKQELFHTQ